MDDKHARCLINRPTRIDIYRQLNPWDVSLNGDNCPAAAAALFHSISSRRFQASQLRSRELSLPTDLAIFMGPGVRFGVTSPLGKNCTLRSEARFARPEGSQLAISEPGILSPVVIAGQVDVLPL